MPPVNAAQRAERNVSIGSHLRALREQRGLTRGQLGAIAGVSAGVVQDYEDGTKALPVARAAEFGEIGVLAMCSYLLSQLPECEHHELVRTGSAEPSVEGLHALITLAAKLSGAVVARLSGQAAPELGSVARECAVAAWRLAGSEEASVVREREQLRGLAKARGQAAARRSA